MPPITQEPMAQLNQAVRAVVSRFNFERPVEIVGRSSVEPTTGSTPADADIYDGTIVTAHGYARLALHKPTGTVCLFTSKTSANLRGLRDAGNAIIATHDGLNRSYITAAYRSTGNDADIHRITPQARRALRRFNEDLGERSEKHFTLYGVKTVTENGREIEFHTNGRLAYRISKVPKSGNFKVTFHTPTKRKDGSFVPVELDGKTLSSHFASVSRVISRTATYEQARHDMALHWQTISSRLWDEKSIYEGEGFYLNTKKNISQFFNRVAEKAFQISLVTATIGLGMGLISTKYGLMGGLVAAITHTVAHHLLDESYAVSKESWAKVREARRRLDIDAYPYNEDVSDHFKIQTRQNISKLCAKMDMQRFNAADFEWLTASRSGMTLDHEKTKDGFIPSSLDAHLLFVHQRGFSSSCALPDPRTRLDIFQSGLVRLIHEKKDGKVVIYCRYRPDACVQDILRLPAEKIQKMGAGIMRLEYDRRSEDFHHAFQRNPMPVSMDDMMKEMSEKLLFVDNPGVAQDVRARSVQAIFDSFILPAEEKRTPSAHYYMSGKPPSLPSLQALSV